MNFPSKITTVKDSVLYTSYIILKNFDDKIEIGILHKKLEKELEIDIFIDSLVFLLVIEKINLINGEIIKCY